jgi:hypothetical protein
MYERIIEWHRPDCKGRHGVVRNIEQQYFAEVADMLVYFFGNKCYKNTKNADGTWNFEFVPMTKVFPPPRRPWEWCGETVLFNDWKEQERKEHLASLSFTYGDKVKFFHKGKTHRGIVAGMNKRITVIVGNAKWHIPPLELEHDRE